MSPLTQIFTVLTLVSLTLASKSHGKNNTCQEFTQGQEFNESLAFGAWHLLHYSTEKTNGSGDAHCIEISPVNEKDRKDLSELVGMYVENLKWESLTLKMQIPCAARASNRTRVRVYYLERLEGDGSYRTLQMPPTLTKLDLAEFHRYPMRLKIIEHQYLGMMDCHEKFVFLLGKQPPEGRPVDDHLRKMIEMYWPDE